ncbi:MAG: DNA translocase SpoIIIE [Flavobacteriales bacterium UBA4585]|nr:MAG: DNA translocase SpoIIIE [Flavobacteriales bacterium UBA4585]
MAPEPEEEELLPEPALVSKSNVVSRAMLDDANNEEPSEIDVVVAVHQEAIEDDKSINKKVKDFGEYDPTLDLSKFQLPKIELLQPYGDGKITFDKEEIEANKNRIVDTLKNYNIEIKEIKATIGPTVTLYEIVPAAGIRISKIKNLEDDIALSLAALGIRIIAPIPGKGTIGIEVPNANPQVVSMRQVIASKKFQESNMELPVAMGRTITNENFIFDLAKMPHLLMAGATGQGKSVGLNAILTSLLYKKHPSQLKFVLVDPKKVELTLYNKIERHYLAVLPDTDEAIITDTAKVINTLNSLCIEMDNRYELLKGAMVRNIKEYNAKFIARRLNPEEGHKFLPYIVLVIDEFADLIMTAGKEVEMPIARLAQLARAIGIHLIVATQRPSVNVITGIIKANFPARAAFRVTSKIDSRTILDAGGADQLIGKGDMLFSQGSNLVRLQCAFVDTPEVEEICDFIGNQQAYPTAYQLPEYVSEEGGGIGDIDPSDRDSLFMDAARLVVQSQQGSTSMIQRKLKLGYNRAGRIVDQLEAAGILGPFEGSKARQVLVPDEIALEQKLKGDA